MISGGHGVRMASELDNSMFHFIRGNRQGVDTLDLFREAKPKRVPVYWNDHNLGGCHTMDNSETLSPT